jgi:hypothetical protein
MLKLHFSTHSLLARKELCTNPSLFLNASNFPFAKGLVRIFVEKLMHVGKFKKFTAYYQHTNTSAYMRITESETITERTQVYPGKPSWGRKPSQNFSLDSSTKYNTSTRP